jgi:hypothetical protein
MRIPLRTARILAGCMLVAVAATAPSSELKAYLGRCGRKRNDV